MNNDDFFKSNTSGSSKIDSQSEIVVARKALSQYVGYCLFGIIMIAGAIFLIVKLAEIGTVIYAIAGGLGFIGAILLLVAILGFVKPMDLAIVKDGKLWVYKKGEFDLGEIVKVTDRRSISNTSDNILLASKNTYGKMIIKLSNGKRIVLNNIENVRRSVLKLRELLGL